MTLPLLLSLLLGSQVSPDFASLTLSGGSNQALLKGGQYFRYIRAIEQELTDKPSDASLHASLALGYYLVGQQQFCDEEIGQALSLLKVQRSQPAPSSAQIYYLAGRLEMETSRYSEAADHLQAALLLDPSNAKIEYFLAVCFKNENRQTNAITHFERACRMDIYSWPCRALAEIELDKGNAIAAESYANSAIKIEPTSAEAQVAAGKAAQALGKLPMAASLFQAAAALDKSWQVPHYLLAHLYQSMPGKAAEAAQELALFQYLYEAGK